MSSDISSILKLGRVAVNPQLGNTLVHRLAFHSALDNHPILYQGQKFDENQNPRIHSRKDSPEQTYENPNRFL